MNCADFEHLLFDHLDASLGDEAMKACADHAASCEACQAALARHRQLAREISDQFERRTECLTLGVAARTRILEQCGQQTGWERVLALWRWGVAAAVLVVLVGLIVGRAFRPGVVQVARGKATPAMVSVRMPQVVATYTFRKEGELVVDTLVYRTNLVQETLWANYRPNLADPGRIGRSAL